MLNTIYRLVAPRRFEVAFQDIDLNKNNIIVRPTHLSICHADQRYYQGIRPAEILAKKLPMALLHEGIGEVVYDPLMEFKKGELVVMIPNTPVDKDDIISENYLRSSKFRASGFDGFMQDLVAMGRDRIVPISKSIPRRISAFTELMSVSVHAMRRFMKFSHDRRKVIGIWGDGNLGYITGLFLKYMIPDTHLIIFGTGDDKLASFSFADEVINVTKMPDDLSIDHAVECVGGAASGKAVDQIIDHINPEGSISLLGVSEFPIPINTRMVLEKGLNLFGSSRSGYTDFVDTVRLLEENDDLVNYLERLVNAVVPVYSIEDMTKAFEMDIHKLGGKTILEWNK